LRRFALRRFIALVFLWAVEGQRNVRVRRYLRELAMEWLGAFCRLNEGKRRGPARRQFRPLRLELLGTRIMLQGTLNWGGGSGSWTSENWYASNPQSLVYWVPGSNAVFPKTSTEINITIPAGTQESVNSLAFVAGGNSGITDYDISGGSIDISATPTNVDVAAYTTVEIDSTFVGPGQLVTNGTGTLIVGSAANSYSGGTNIEYGILQLTKDPVLLAAATLGSGGVTIGNTAQAQAELNLNGCPLTLSSLSDNTGVNGLGEIVTDTSSGPRGAPVGTTVLTVANTSADTFSGGITDSYSISNPGAASIRLVKMGSGTLTLGGQSDFSGGAELDQGMTVMNNVDALSSGVLTVNGGTLDLHTYTPTFSALDGSDPSGEITDNSGQGVTTVLTINMSQGGHPSLFAGSIDDGTGTKKELVRLSLDGEGLLTLTGDNQYTGGTYIEDGWLQVGDGTTNGSIEGPVYDNTQDGLTFDVVAGTGSPETFNGAILAESSVGSVQKTGSGTLVVTGNATYGQSSYLGATEVDGGTLYLGDAGAIPSTTSLIVDNGATVDLGGNPVNAETVALNNGTIQSTDGNGTNEAGTLVAGSFFNFANGTIDPDVTLGGAASLDKRTSGTVYFQGTSNNLQYTGGTFEFQGNLSPQNGGYAPPVTQVTMLYWNPPANVSLTWDTSNRYWWNGTTDQDQSWPTINPQNYVAVFDQNHGHQYNNGSLITVDITVSTAEIDYLISNYDIESESSSQGEILVPGAESLLVTVPTLATDTLGCVVTGSGGITMEGPGTLELGSPSNTNSYDGGTFVDAGTLTLENTDALGVPNYSIPDSTDLVVDDSGVVNLNGQSNVTITSLNSSYASSGAQNGIVTDYSGTGGTTTLTIDVSGTPGIFGGTITNGTNNLGQTIELDVNCQSGVEGLLMTLTGQNTYTGGTFLQAGLQIGDGTTNGSVEGQIDVGGGLADDLIFDVVGSTPQIFNGWITSTSGGSLLKTGSGTLKLTGDTNWGGDGNDYDGITRIEGGTLKLGDATALPGNSNVIIDDGAALDLNGYSLDTSQTSLTSVFVDDGTVESSSGGATLEATNLVDVAYGAVSANLIGTMTLLKSPGVGSNVQGIAQNTVCLSGANSFSGASLLSSGTLQLQIGAITGLSNASNLVINGGTLDINANGTQSSPVEVTSVAMTALGGSIISSSGGTPVLAAVSYVFAPDAAITGTVASPVLLEDYGSNTHAPLVVSGPGTLLIAGTSSYSGATTVESGTLTVTSATSLPEGTALIVDAGATFIFDPSGGGSLSVASVTMGANGAVVLDAANLITTGQVTLSNGTITIYSGATLTIPNTSTWNSTGEVDIEGGTLVDNASNVTFGVLVMNGTTTNPAIISASPGTNALNFSWLSETGTATIASGTVSTSGSDHIHGALTVNSGGGLSVGSGGVLAINSGGSLTISGTLTNNGTLTDSGTFTNNAGDTFTNNSGSTLTVNGGGTLTTAVNSELDNYGTVNNNSGGSLTIGGWMDIEDGATVTGNVVTSSTGAVITDQENAPMTCGVNVSGIGSVYDEGMNTLNLSGNITGSLTVYLYSCGSMTLSGNNNFAELINLEGGEAVLVVGSANALGPSNVCPGIDIAGGVINLNGYNVTLDDLIGPQGCGYITDDSSGSGTTTLTINNTGTQTFGGFIENGPSKTIALVKQGTGTLILTGANTYTGSTTVSNGTVQIGHNMTLGTISAASGATLQINSGDTLTHNGALSDAGTITNYGTLIDSATSDIASGGSLNDASGSTQYINYAMTVEGTLNNSGGTVDTDATVTDNGTVTNAASLTMTADGAIYVGSSTTATLTNSGTINAAGGLHVYAHGALTNNSGATLNVTYGPAQVDSGGTISNSGTFEVNGSSLTFYDYGTFTGNVVVTSGNTFEFCQSANITYAGIISGAGSVVVACPTHTVIFTNAETYSGTTYVQTGTLELGNGTTNGSLASASTINVSSGATVEFYENANETYTNTITGAGSLTDGNSHTITLSGNHSGFTGSKGTGIVW